MMQNQEEDSLNKLSPLSAEDKLSFKLNSTEKELQFEEILKKLLPHIKGDNEDDKIILAEVLIALKLEGLIGKNMGYNDSHLLSIVCNAVASSPERKKEAIDIAKKLLKSGDEVS